jgi:hypothetical protein
LPAWIRARSRLNGHVRAHRGAAATACRANLVTSRKEGSAVYYSLTSPHVTELLAVARQILTGVLSGQADLLQDLRTSILSP